MPTDYGAAIEISRSAGMANQVDFGIFRLEAQAEFGRRTLGIGSSPTCL